MKVSLCCSSDFNLSPTNQQSPIKPDFSHLDGCGKQVALFQAGSGVERHCIAAHYSRLCQAASPHTAVLFSRTATQRQGHTFCSQSVSWHSSLYTRDVTVNTAAEPLTLDNLVPHYVPIRH